MKAELQCQSSGTIIINPDMITDTATFVLICRRASASRSCRRNGRLRRLRTGSERQWFIAGVSDRHWRRSTVRRSPRHSAPSLYSNVLVLATSHAVGLFGAKPWIRRREGSRDYERVYSQKMQIIISKNARNTTRKYRNTKVRRMVTEASVDAQTATKLSLIHRRVLLKLSNCLQNSTRIHGI